MNREWKPGDVALVPFERGDERAFWTADGWVTHDFPESRVKHYADVRPLVVIDPEGNPEGLEYLVPQHFRSYAATLRKHHGPVSAQMLEWLADQLEAFVPPPPKPDEPQGLGAVVEDGSGFTYTRFSHTEAHNEGEWINEDGLRVQWSSIAAIRVLSPGVEVDQ